MHPVLWSSWPPLKTNSCFTGVLCSQTLQAACVDGAQELESYLGLGDRLTPSLLLSWCTESLHRLGDPQQDRGELHEILVLQGL